MADLPTDQSLEPRVREFLWAELRQAELDFRPPLPKPVRVHAALSAIIAAIVLAVIVVAVAVPRLVGPAAPGIVSDGSPSVSLGPIASVASSTSPVASIEPATPAPTITVGDWSVTCDGVLIADCEGAVGRFTNLLARDTQMVFDESEGRLNVSARPTCPTVSSWADGSYCWQVTAVGATWSSSAEPVCMVIAKRGTDPRYPAYVHVGGPDGTGRAGGMPAGWPSCN